MCTGSLGLLGSSVKYMGVWQICGSSWAVIFMSSLFLVV